MVIGLGTNVTLKDNPDGTYVVTINAESIQENWNKTITQFNIPKTILGAETETKVVDLGMSQRTFDIKGTISDYSSGSVSALTQRDRLRTLATGYKSLTLTIPNKTATTSDTFTVFLTKLTILEDVKSRDVATTTLDPGMGLSGDTWIPRIFQVSITLLQGTGVIQEVGGF